MSMSMYFSLFKVTMILIPSGQLHLSTTVGEAIWRYLSLLLPPSLYYILLLLYCPYYILTSCTITKYYFTRYYYLD